MNTDALARSWLYVPAHKPRMIAKSIELPADVVIYDYEDAVPPAEKAAARGVLAGALPATPPPNSPRRYVRVNHPRHGSLFVDDLYAALALNVEGIVLPKVEGAAQVQGVSAAILREEERVGIEPGTTRLCLLIESPLGVVRAQSICAADPRIIAVQFGGEDFSREMGLPLVRTGEAKELLYQRSAVATAASAAGAQAIDVIWTALDDLAGLLRSPRRPGGSATRPKRPSTRRRSDPSTPRSARPPRRSPTRGRSSPRSRRPSPKGRE